MSLPRTLKLAGLNPGLNQIANKEVFSELKNFYDKFHIIKTKIAKDMEKTLKDEDHLEKVFGDDDGGICNNVFFYNQIYIIMA